MIDNLELRFREAVQSYWDVLLRQGDRQIAGGRVDAGTRSRVTGGTQMGEMERLISDIVIAAGVDTRHLRTRSHLELPGYYRPEKQWDLLVVSGDRLVLAIEFKSQVGPSFGNNFNNRVEEAIGNAEDIWTAYREGRFGKHPAPFLGYLFLLENCPQVHSPIRNSEPYFAVDPILKNSSYAQRYAVLCERLLLERKYTATCLALATNSIPTEILFPEQELSFGHFAAAIDAHARLFATSG